MAEQINDNELCHRCESISWDSVYSGDADPQFVYDSNETTELLLQSSCRLCSFFGKVKLRNNTRTTGRIWRLSGRRNEERDIEPALLQLEFRLSSSRGEWGTDSGIFLTRQDLMGENRTLREMFPGVLNIPRLTSWIHQCHTTHDSVCSPASANTLKNLKLIDCEVRSIVNAPEDSKYAALSYVWGDSERSEMPHVHTLENTPLVVEDSMGLVLRMGYKYLWVDRYCIDQSSSSAIHEQVTQMASVYEAAQFTIIDASSQGTQLGLPGLRSFSRQSNWNWQRVGDYVLMQVPDYTDTSSIRYAPWAKRGWTLQECYFSKRRLFFTDDQVIFACNSKIGYEIAPYKAWWAWDVCVEDSPFADPYRFRGLATSFPIEAFGRVPRLTSIDRRDIMNLLVEYSSRILTFDSDALRAIVGALKCFRNYGLQHIWGVPIGPLDAAQSEHLKTWNPTDSLLNSEFTLPLAWYHRQTYIGNERRVGMPSWSPLGWRAQVYRWMDVEANKLISEGDSVMKVRIQSKMNLRAEDETDMIDQGNISQVLEIRGRIADLYCAENDPMSPSERLVRLKLKNHVFPELPVNLELAVELNWDIQVSSRSKFKEGHAFKGLLAMQESGLAYILLLDNNGLHYERVGFFTVDYRPYSWQVGPSEPLFFANEWWQESFQQSTILLG